MPCVRRGFEESGTGLDGRARVEDMTRTELTQRHPFEATDLSQSRKGAKNGGNKRKRLYCCFRRYTPFAFRMLLMMSSALPLASCQASSC